MAKSIDLYIDQGADFTAILPPVTDTSGDVFDLTDYTVLCQIRRSYADIFAVQITTEVSDGPTGVITLSLANTETSGLYPLRYVYDVIIVSTDNIRTKVFDGLMIVNPGVSDKPNTTLLTP